MLSSRATNGTIDEGSTPAPQHRPLQPADDFAKNMLRRRRATCFGFLVPVQVARAWRAECQQAREHHPPACGEPSLLNRSYTLEPRWPFDAWHLVMELETPGSCDLYSTHARFFCCAVAGKYFEPERHVREAIASFLHGCHRRQCRSVDIGANNGWMTAYMLLLGSHVVSVEPQPDLAAAVKQTAELNCWASRSVVHNARACAANDMACMQPTRAEGALAHAWRYGNEGGPSQISHRHGQNLTRVLGLHRTVGGVRLAGLLLGDIDFVKLDADGPEGDWLMEIDALTVAGKTNIRTLLVEGSHLSPWTMMRFQRVHGYTVLRMDEHDGRRHMDPKG